MGFSYGFYNSLDGDRKYDAEDFAKVFDSFIEDGVIRNFGNNFAVRAAGGLNLLVGTGRSWFRRTWSLNDTDYPLVAAAASASTARLDAVILEVDTTLTVRRNRIFYATGTASAYPVLISNDSVKQYPLAYISRTVNGNSIAQTDITPMVGTTQTPWAANRLLDRTWEPAAMHRNVFRGKSLGNAVTAAQSAAIANATFDDLYIGDYWTINGINWRIVDLDYWYGKGDNKVTTHHVALMPDTTLMNAPINATNTIAGAYNASDMNQKTLPLVRNIVYSAFNGKVVNTRALLTNAVNDLAMPSGLAWYGVDMLPPNTYQMFGTSHFGPMASGGALPTNQTEAATQLALFALAPTFIPAANGVNFWLRDVVFSAHFALIASTEGGTANRAVVNTTQGVRPVFAIK